MPDVTPENEIGRAAFLGSIYSNYLALEAALEDIARRGVDAVYALGDFGAFGPYPDRTLDLLRKCGIPCIQGNYEQSLSTGADDCNCGYTHSRDNHYARLSYDYTFMHTSARHKQWMGRLPGQRRIRLGKRSLLLCHGSPRKINEFLWRTTTPAPFIARLLKNHAADTVVCTHTGLHWHRFLEPGRGIINAGALGRPANDGRTDVWYTLVEAAGEGLRVEHVPLAYDHERLAREMQAEGLPPEFVETIRTGWWTTCLEALPAKERALGRY